MYHETNHYLQKLIDVDFSYPHFPGESLAEYYGASRYDPDTKKFSTGLILEGRLAEVKRDVLAGEMMELDKLLSSEGMYEHYTWGWTLVHFLMNDPRRAKAFKKFVLALPQDKDVEREPTGFGNVRTCTAVEVRRVFMDRLGLEDGDDLKELEQAWHDYVRERLEFVSARGLELAALSAKRSGLPIKAKKLFGEAIEAGSRNPLTFHHYAELLVREGDRGAAIAQWRKALELDPLGAEFHLSLGQALYREGDEEEGLRRMRLAREIDDDVLSWTFDTDLLEKLDGE
jgi:tetratricopeptide (TPR) repeat protein